MVREATPPAVNPEQVSFGAWNIVGFAVTHVNST